MRSLRYLRPLSPRLYQPSFTDMKLSHSPDFFESVANHPEVFEKIAPAGLDRVSFSDAWGACLGFEFEDGGFLVHHHGDGLYELHTLFLPHCKGVLAKGRQVIHFLFCATDCTELVTRIPCDLPKPRGLALAAGFIFRGKREGVFPRANGPIDVEWFGMTIDEFIVADRHVQKLGQSFHERLEREGIDTNHGNDPWHDRYVGYALSCNALGQRDKGITAYNRWARYAGFLPLEWRDGKLFFGGGYASFAPHGLILEAA